MSHTYLDRTGIRINETNWKALQEDPSYRTVREFDNGVVLVRLVWNGKLNRVDTSSFRDTWPVFELRVLNYRDDGTAVPDPVADNATFPDEESAIRAYEEFLLDWTDCDRKDDGTFVEVDNVLAPPPPPDPNVPTSVIKDAPEDLGAAW